MVVRCKQMAGRKERGGKHRGEKDGHPGRCVRINFWRKPLPPMEKNGTDVSARKRKDGRDGDAADVKRGILPCCKGRTGRQSRQKQENVHQDPLQQVEERIYSTVILRQKFGSCVKSSRGTRVQRRSKGFRMSPQVKRAGLKKMGRWRWMKKLIARRSWMRRKKSIAKTVARPREVHRYGASFGGRATREVAAGAARC